MHSIRQFLIFVFLMSCGSATALADGGQIRAVREYRGHRMTVFTSPTPMRAGPVDISVLIQHAASGEIVDGSAIAVEMAQADAMSTPLWSLATAEAATNKLLRAANFELPNAGLWQVQIECKMDGEDAPWQTSFEMEVGPPKPAWAAIWPWVTWPFAAIALFAIHRMLVQRRRGRLILNTTSRRLSFP